MKTIVKIGQNSSISRIDCVLPPSVSGIGYSQTKNSIVFYSASSGSFGFVGDDGNIEMVSRRLEVVNPIGICCDQWGMCVLQFNPDMAWNFNQSYESGMRLFGRGIFSTLFKNVPENVNDFSPYGICRINKTSVIIALPWGNKLLRLEDGQKKNQIGSGKCGFLSSSSEQSSMFSHPSGVCFDQGKSTMLVSDTGNSIIRIFKGGKEIGFVGLPNTKGTHDGIGTSATLTSPSVIRTNNGVVSFIDNNLVRTFNIADLSVSTVYASSQRIVDLAIGGGSVYILEDRK